ncbi:MAG: c-type cytochrome [Ardenticatenaceae bacterium]
MSRFSILFSMLLLCLLLACQAGPFAEAPTPTVDPVVARGQKVFSKHCASCHALSPDTIIVGPSLANIATRGASRMDGLDARQYIELSILNPSLYVVDGFEDAMPSNLAKKITGEELDDLVTYLLTRE